VLGWVWGQAIVVGPDNWCASGLAMPQKGCLAPSTLPPTPRSPNQHTCYVGLCVNIHGEEMLSPNWAYPSHEAA
jgi:hypothetical protein